MPTATDYWQDQTKDTVLESINRLKAAQQAQRTDRIDKLDDFAKGGDHVADYLTQYEEEEDNDYYRRQARRAVANYAAKIAEAIIAGVYGDKIGLTFEDDEKSKKNDALTDVLKYNRWSRKQRRIGWGQVVLGDGWVNLAYVERAKSIGIQPVRCDNVYFLTNPANDEEIDFAVEYRPHPTLTGKGVYWIWTPEWYNVVDQDGREVEIEVQGQAATAGKKDNPYKLVPLVRFPGRVTTGSDYGISYIEDAVDLQCLLLNWMSDMDVGMIYQIYSLLVTSGPGDPTVVVGGSRQINVGMNGDAKYIAPNCDFAAIRENAEMVIRHMCDGASVPLQVIRGGDQANSGYQALLQMQPMIRVVDTIKTDARTSLVEMGEKMNVIGAHHEIWGKGEVDVKATFAANVTPTDKDAQREQDRADLANGLLTEVDYLIMYNDAIETEKDAEEYLAKIAEEQAKGKPERKEGSDPFSFLDDEDEDEGE